MFVVVRVADDVLKLYGPPPGPVYDDLGRRRWLSFFDGRPQTQTEIDSFLARQSSFDPDIWVIDIDDPQGGGLLDQLCSE